MKEMVRILQSTLKLFDYHAVEEKWPPMQIQRLPIYAYIMYELNSYQICDNWNETTITKPIIESGHIRNSLTNIQNMILTSSI